MWFHLYVDSKKKQKQMKNQNLNRLTNTENRLAEAIGVGDEGMGKIDGEKISEDVWKKIRKSINVIHHMAKEEKPRLYQQMQKKHLTKFNTHS